MIPRVESDAVLSPRNLPLRIFYQFKSRIRKEFTKEINKVKPSMKSIPFISVYNLTERTERSFSKIKLFASDISLLTFVVFPIAEEVKV